MMTLTAVTVAGVLGYTGAAAGGMAAGIGITSLIKHNKNKKASAAAPAKKKEAPKAASAAAAKSTEEKKASGVEKVQGEVVDDKKDSSAA